VFEPIPVVAAWNAHRLEVVWDTALVSGALTTYLSKSVSHHALIRHGTAEGRRVVVYARGSEIVVVGAQSGDLTAYLSKQVSNHTLIRHGTAEAQQLAAYERGSEIVLVGARQELTSALRCVAVAPMSASRAL